MKKGISVIALSVSIVLIVVIASVISLSLIENYKEAQKIEFAAELDMLRISSENYKLSNGYYPVLDETLDVSLIPDELKNTQFEGENTEGINSFNLLDYNLIGVDSLKYGTGETPNDRYVVSTKTGRIYYLKGLNIGNEIYYSMNPELKGLLSGNSPLEKNSDAEVIFKEDYSNNQFKIITYIPVKYTVNSVKFEEQSIVLDKMTESYYEYKLIPNKVGTINVDYSYNGESKLVKHIINDVDLTLDPTKKIYTLTFNANGGTSTMESITKPEGYAIEMPTATKTGYTFIGWYESITGGEVISYTKMPNYSKTLYAHWIPNTYTVTYNVNGGNTLSETGKTVTYDSSYGILPEPTRNGYSFLGWYTDATNGVEITSSTIVQKAEDHTIYAHWEAEYRTLTLDANGGTITQYSQQTTKTITKLIGESITLDTPIRSEYNFLGWYTASSGGTKVEYTTMPNETQTIYAHWEAKPVIWFTNGPYIEGTYYISCTRTSATIPAGSTVYYSVQFYGDSRDTTSASASITLGGNSMYSDYNVSSTKSVSDSFYVSSSSSLSMSCMAGSYICGNSNCQGTSISVTITKVVGSDGREYLLKRSSSGTCQ